jgi:hypothetical protein
MKYFRIYIHKCNVPQYQLECDSCLRWQHRTCGSGVTVLEYRNWTGDQEYICSVCRDAEPESSVDIEVRYIYECIYENIRSTSPMLPS